MDTVVYRGASHEYTIGATTVVDSQAGRDGSDQFASIEYLEFSDQTIQVGNGTTSYCSTAANSAGAGEHISSSGSTSISANDLQLMASGGIASQPGLFYFGPLQIQAPFGDGFRCVGGTTHRLQPAQTSDASGQSTRALDFTSEPLASAVAPGQTWFFQHWYRDPAGPGGSGFNLSDGLSVPLLP